ncbi:hypothetical protein FA95DRAFT_31882 [Auriscalpium vulgare]|uniref:Uncharacterized protein n=1 Tax=Auriscalpium vulgare TaxID=40419 RepID=A0ACB8SDS5_9AGAM|nr:hypothetical protein FA95DRAFT_31882 [Auriscalpium vulgare]
MHADLKASCIVRFLLFRPLFGLCNGAQIINSTCHAASCRHVGTSFFPNRNSNCSHHAIFCLRICWGGKFFGATGEPRRAYVRRPAPAPRNTPWVMSRRDNVTGCA